MPVMHNKKKGGARNYKKPATDTDHLCDILKELAKENGPDIFDLYEYKDSVSPSIRPRLQSLAKMKNLLMAMVAANPHMTILYTDLKNTLLDIFRDIKESKPPGSTPVTAATNMASALMIVQRHCRDLDEDTIMDSNLSKFSRESLLEIVRAILPSSSTSASSLGSSVKSPSKRKLEKIDSELSLDGYGLPKVSPLKRSLNAVGDDAGQVGGDFDADDAEEEKLLGKASVPLPSKKKGIKKMKEQQAKEAKKAEEAEPRKVMKAMKDKKVKKAKKAMEDFQLDCNNIKVCGPFKAQSYLQQIFPDGTFKLVVACSSKQSVDHGKVIKDVLKYLKKQKKPTKSMAREKRDLLVYG